MLRVVGCERERRLSLYEAILETSEQCRLRLCWEVEADQALVRFEETWQDCVLGYIVSAMCLR
jgi:hypothetical protein